MEEKELHEVGTEDWPSQARKGGHLAREKMREGPPGPSLLRSCEAWRGSGLAESEYHQRG